MLKKKFFAKALAFALVMGTVSVYGSGVVAPISIVQAADTAVKITYADYTAEITPVDGTDKYVFLEVLKDQAGTKVSATYCYPVTDGKAVVDLSFLKAAKDQYLEKQKKQSRLKMVMNLRVYMEVAGRSLHKTH